MLVELLRATSREDEAREQLEKLAGEIEGRGERLGAARPPQERPRRPQEEDSASRPSRPAAGGLVFLDTGVDLPPAQPPSAATSSGRRSPRRAAALRADRRRAARHGRRAGGRRAGSGAGARGGSRGHRARTPTSGWSAWSPLTSSSSASRSKAWTSRQDDLVDDGLLDATDGRSDRLGRRTSRSDGPSRGRRSSSTSMEPELDEDAARGPEPAATAGRSAVAAGRRRPASRASSSWRARSSTIPTIRSCTCGWPTGSCRRRGRRPRARGAGAGAGGLRAPRRMAPRARRCRSGW